MHFHHLEAGWSRVMPCRSAVFLASCHSPMILPPLCYSQTICILIRKSTQNPWIWWELHNGIPIPAIFPYCHTEYIGASSGSSMGVAAEWGTHHWYPINSKSNRLDTDFNIWVENWSMNRKGIISLQIPFADKSSQWYSQLNHIVIVNHTYSDDIILYPNFGTYHILAS